MSESVLQPGQPAGQPWPGLPLYHPFGSLVAAHLNGIGCQRSRKDRRNGSPVGERTFVHMVT